MKRIVLLAAAFVFLLVTMVQAQWLKEDKKFIQVMSVEHPITIDGRLDELDWQRRIDYLAFRPNFKPGDISYRVTGWEYTDPQWVPEANGPNNDGYTDTTTTTIKFLHYGTDLYIAITSDDHSICKRFGGWEGDGLFMKVKIKGTAVAKEYKLFYIDPAVGSSAVFETNGPADSGEGVSYEFPGTIANDNTAPDSGYTAEMVIHLDKLGYSAGDSVEVSMMIFDMDFYTPEHESNPDPDLCDYYKTWWGSQWGSEFRYLILSDPPVVAAYSLEEGENITVDGQLTEPAWNHAEYLDMYVGSPDISNRWYMQWGDTLNAYTDQSHAIVKFLHKGTDLYIGVISNDSSVCEWSPGWEADGLFLWMRGPDEVPLPGQRNEIKCMYFGMEEGSSAKFEVNDNVPSGGAEGASYEFPGTVTHTETNGPDHGYSIEVVIHTDMWGYADGDSVWLSLVIWDMDYASIDAYDPHVSDYAPMWWGTQWCDTNFEKYYLYRQVYLSPSTDVDEKRQDTPIVRTYALYQNFPNPFNPETTIQYELPKRQHVSLGIYNVLGQKIRTLVDGIQESGIHTVRWDGKTDNSESVVSGVYFYRIETGDFVQIRKMVYIR
ncbi:T9SS type A sorting domain-containing protein [bacterium]|nr:T9SS type A sorting domain-containing protein [bacterium]